MRIIAIGPHREKTDDFTIKTIIEKLIENEWRFQ